jgi:hypothetical protein
MRNAIPVNPPLRGLSRFVTLGSTFSNQFDSICRCGLKLVLIGYVGLVSATYVFAQQAPTILIQPTNQTVSSGSDVRFIISAAGEDPLSYRWLKEGVNLADGGKVAGATNAVLTIFNVQGNELGAYSVIVRNDYGEVQSLEVILSIVPVVAWGANGFGADEVPFGLSNVTSIAAGYGHSLAVTADSRVAAWGENDNGQCDIPPGLTDVRAVATGWQHSLALREDGTVIAWGRNSYGSTIPPADLTNAIAVAAGSGHSAALTSEGAVVVWGNDFYGQATVPQGLTNVVAISAGYSSSMALRANGTVALWGVFDRVHPAWVPETLSNVVAVSAGYDHCLALRDDGTVVAWGGENYYFQTNVPPGLTGVVAIAAGGAQSVALRADGRLVVWGWYAPPPPNTLSHVVAISAGSRYTLALVDPEYYPQLSIRREAANVALSWTGGRGPFQVLQRTSLLLPEEWENVGEPVETNVITLPIDADVRFLRVLDLAAPTP